MSATKKFLTATLIAASLAGGISSASAADTKDAAIARAQTHATYTAQMDSYIAAHRAIIDAHRAANAKALADFQAALTSATTPAQVKAAKEARKAATAAAKATSDAAHAALVKPTKPVKPVKAPKA
jgi:hypothetical protein